MAHLTEMCHYAILFGLSDFSVKDITHSQRRVFCFQTIRRRSFGANVTVFRTVPFAVG